MGVLCGIVYFSFELLGGGVFLQNAYRMHRMDGDQSTKFLLCHAAQLSYGMEGVFCS